MALSVDKVEKGLWLVAGLQTFPLFCLYLAIIPLSVVWQKVSKPLQLKPILILYNFTCCLISLYTLIGFTRGLLENNSIFQKEDSNSIKPYFRIYWITKMLELLDTVFMILRHRRRQITFLHVYHHSSMLILSDLACNLYPWPTISVYLAMNSFVHFWLYMYYGLAAVSDQPPAWKRHMTELQIVQFLLGFVHATIGYHSHGFCIYGVFYGITMTTLFSNFYYQAYIKKKGKLN